MADVKFEDVARRVYVRSVEAGRSPVSWSAGRMLYMMVLALGAATDRSLVVVEVGTGYGFSTLWLARALRELNRGRLYSFDPCQECVKEAARALAEAGLMDYVELIPSRLEDSLDKLPHVIDVVFLDAKKENYGLYLRLLKPRLRLGSIVMAHNVIAPSPHKLSDFLEEISKPEWVAVITQVDYAGLSISLYRPQK